MKKLILLSLVLFLLPSCVATIQLYELKQAARLCQDWDYGIAEIRITPGGEKSVICADGKKLILSGPKLIDPEKDGK